MPGKALPSEERFKLFCEHMEKRGFRRVSRGKFRGDFQRLGLEAPRPREGAEVGFEYDENGLNVRVWTTYLDAEGYARDEDAGWVIIRDGDRARYFSHPMHRTANFLRRLYRWAEVAQLRINNRPRCPKCFAYMRIAYGAAVKSRYWECPRRARHAEEGPVWLDWDCGLKKYPKAYAFVTVERKKRKRYRDKARAKGKKPGTAILKRRPWKVTRPQNVVPRGRF